MQKCAVCGKGLLHCRMPIMARFEVQLEEFDEAAIRRAHGFEEFVGNVAIARIMGTDDEIAKPKDEPRKGYVCFQCLAGHSIMSLVLGQSNEEEEVAP